MENKTFQFPNATVIYTEDKSRATGRVMPSLSVQVIDAYGFQREWCLKRRPQPGDNKTLYWESHIYMHPGRREICKVGEAQAKACIARFLELCEKYPDLLFNAANERQARCQGFVTFAEQLHRGAVPSQKLL